MITTKGFVTAILLMIANSSLAEIYKWRDEHGRLHFGDRPPVTVESETVTVKPNTYSAPRLDDHYYDFTSPPSQQSVANKVTLYSAVWCAVCKKAKRYFAENNIAYTEYDVEKSKKGRNDYKKLKATGVPIILVGKRRMNGFSAATLQAIYKP